MSTVDLRLLITNIYADDGTEIVNTVDVRLPDPEDGDLYEWAEEHIFPLTGTGRTEGDSAYFVEVLDGPLSLQGEQWEWGV